MKINCVHIHGVHLSVGHKFSYKYLYCFCEANEIPLYMAFNNLEAFSSKYPDFKIHIFLHTHIDYSALEILRTGSSKKTKQVSFTMILPNSVIDLDDNDFGCYELFSDTVYKGLSIILKKFGAHDATIEELRLNSLLLSKDFFDNFIYPEEG